MLAFLKDPLVHFLVIGGILFFALENAEPKEQELETGYPETAQLPEIRITNEIAENIWKSHEQILGRPLTPDEKDRFIQSHLDQEILVREAYRLKLNEDDASIRQRLVDKVRFLYVGPVPDPSRDDLRRFYESNIGKYVNPPTVTVEHVLISKNRQEVNDETKALIDQLNSGANPEDMGVPNWLGPILRNLSKTSVRQLFGEQAVDPIWNLPEAKWNGPIYSTHGTHFFKLVERRDELVPEFESLIDTLSSDWRYERQQRVLNGKIEQLKRQYNIHVQVDEAAL